MSDKNSESFEEYWGQNTSGQYGRIERIIAKNAWICCEKLHAKKLQAVEEELSNACELIKSLRELAIDLWENDASETDWLDVDRFHELIEKAEALEKVKRGGHGKD